MSKLLLSPTVLARAQARRAVNHPFWQAVQSAANTVERDFDMANVALAYALTGQSSYGDRAVNLLLSLAAKPVTAIDNNDGYDARSLLPAMSFGFDWCGDRLSDAQKQAVAAKAVAWSERIWPETGGGLSTHWGGWPSSNYMHGFQMTWLVGLAFAGLGVNAERLAAQAFARHQAKTLPRMSKEWRGGYLEEGTNYGVGSLMWMAHYLTGVLSSGTARAALMPDTWYPEMLRAMIHLTTPDRKRLFPGGDQTRVNNAPLSDYSLAGVLSAMDYLPQDDAAMAQYFVDEVYPTRDRIGWTAWTALLWYRDLGPLDYRTRLGTFWFAPGMGIFSSRSSWATDAVQIVAQGGPVIENAHQDQAGHFQLWRGTEWLVGCRKEWSNDGTEHGASMLNTVLIGGKDQVAKSDNRVLFATDTPQFTSWAADLTDTYAELSEWRREIMFLKPNFVIVFDRVQTKQAATEKRWLLHTLGSPTQSGNLIRATAGGSALFSTTLLPAGANITRESLGSSWRTNVRAPNGTLTYFLHVLEAAPGAQTQPVPVAYDGAVLRIGNQAISVGLTATGATPALRLAGDAPPSPPPPVNKPPVANPGGPYTGTVGVPVQFDGSRSSDPDGTIVRWDWRFGDGALGAMQARFSHTYDAPGIYIVNLTVTDDKGATATATTTVTITAAPPVGELKIWLGAEQSLNGAVFHGTAEAAAPLPAGSTITVTARTPDGRTATGTATIAGTPPPPPPSSVLLEDSFDAPGPIPSTTLWMPGVVVSGGTRNAAVGVVQDGGNLILIPTMISGKFYNGLLSRQRYNLTGARATVEVVEATKGSANTQFALVLDAQNFLLWETEGGKLYATMVVGGTRTEVDQPYSATRHRFWRIRDDPATDRVFWEVSADGGAWASLRHPRPFNVTALLVELAAGTYERVNSPGRAVFGSVKVEKG